MIFVLFRKRRLCWLYRRCLRKAGTTRISGMDLEGRGLASDTRKVTALCSARATICRGLIIPVDTLTSKDFESMGIFTQAHKAGA